MATMPTRVDGDLFDAARSAGEAHSRSAAQQLSHWARLGRALESSGGLRHRDIERVLAGSGSYDALGEREQAVVRTTWDERVDAGIAGLNFEAELAAAGDDWSEADAAGHVVRRGAAR